MRGMATLPQTERERESNSNTTDIFRRNVRYLWLHCTLAVSVPFDVYDVLCSLRGLRLTVSLRLWHPGRVTHWSLFHHSRSARKRSNWFLNSVTSALLNCTSLASLMTRYDLDFTCLPFEWLDERSEHRNIFFPPITQSCPISDVLFTGGRGVSDFSVLKYY